MLGKCRSEQIVLAEYEEIRKEILQFQGFQNKMLFGVFGFYVSLAALLFKILAENNISIYAVFDNHIEASWIALTISIINMVVVGMFIAFNITIYRASIYITSELSPRLSCYAGCNTIFGWESYYSKYGLGIVAETIPGVLSLVLLFALSTSATIVTWSQYTSNNYLTLYKIFNMIAVCLLATLTIYWITLQVRKPHFNST